MLPSLNILNLLTDLFDLGFEVNDRVCNIGILALRAGSVSFAVKLLKQKVDLSAYRRACFKHLTELRYMAAQAHGLFINGYFIGKYRRLGKDAGFVYAG